MSNTKKPQHQAVLAIAAELEKKLETLAQTNASIHSEDNDKPGTSSYSKLFNKVKDRVLREFERLRSNLPIDASIVVPVYNHLDSTLRCLESLSKQKSKYNIEVIVVDDASTDQTSTIIPSIPGVNYLRNKKNVGFVGSCNKGAKAAKGKAIIFLNNDTVVLGNWLDALLNRLQDPSIGIVGSKLIMQDGETLQEAGGIIFNNQAHYGDVCWSYGKFYDANRYDFNFLRDVDYVSGASLAIDRKLFLKLGGFDTRYSPGYYEDTDLAMAVRKAGKRVVYEPHSVLVHAEGTTAGTDTSGSGMKRFQPINREKFRKKWARELKKNHYPAKTLPVIAASSRKPKHMLIVDTIVPEHDKDSGSLRMFNIIKAAIRDGYVVTFFPDNLVASHGYTPELQAMGVEVVYGVLTPRLFYKYRRDMYDVIILSRPLAALWHLEYCQAYQPKAKVFYDTVDLHYLRIGRQAVVDNKPSLDREAEQWRQVEYYLMDNTDATIVVSPQEQIILKKEKPGLKTFVISNINPQRPEFAKQSLNFDQRSGLLFIGTYAHTPNRDAATWFVTKVLPLIHKKLPDVEVTLLGSKVTSAIAKLASDKVRVPGYVQWAEPYFYESRVFISPIRYGAGVKGKLSQALACGTPIVSTPMGIEGMSLQNQKECMIAEDPQAFADAVVKLYTDKRLWQRIQTKANRVYEASFSEEAGFKALRHAIKQT